ncbi:motility associated factor glycosyltransferase family protein [Shewanella zhangzhouensis]|uniref:motility associated factor glycosyltransferase family protein n=1 Tax=Shewanella zhangzhouensis TaxID=2864213 RepID=UPI001C654A4A|nr:6-hydroxymethylpterin diphosphokinase MptE-like protein [Shewanella zhangzhouensis]QYK03915.1 DUF115 domain-containing protein [Shewanella zhangzhouensis]
MKLNRIKECAKHLIRNNKFFYDSYDKGFSLGCSNFRKLKDKYKGERAFIVGNGPSLNKHDLSLLKNEYSFAVNGIFYKTETEGFRPTFYVVEDRHVMLDNIDKINEFEAQYKFFPVDYRSKLKNKKNSWFFRMDKGYYHKTSPYFAIPRFSSDMNDKLYCGQSVTMINLQIAYYLGFSEIYLIGMDHSYQIPSDADVAGEEITSNSDDPNHFHPDYFGKGKKWHDPHLDRVERTYEYYRLVFESQNRKIYNATVGGQLEVFDRVDYKSLFK